MSRFAHNIFLTFYQFSGRFLCTILDIKNLEVRFSVLERYAPFLLWTQLLKYLLENLNILTEILPSLIFNNVFQSKSLSYFFHILLKDSSVCSQSKRFLQQLKVSYLWSSGQYRLGPLTQLRALTPLTTLPEPYLLKALFINSVGKMLIFQNMIFLMLCTNDFDFPLIYKLLFWFIYQYKAN